MLLLYLSWSIAILASIIPPSANLLLSPTLINSIDCKSYYGKFEDGFIYSDCNPIVTGRRIKVQDQNEGKLIMIATESSVELEIKQARAEESTLSSSYSNQLVFNNQLSNLFTTLYESSGGSRLIQFSSSASLSAFTSSPEYSLTELVALNPRPNPNSNSLSTSSTVDERSIERIRNQLAQLKLSPSINLEINKISVLQIQSDIQVLSGEEEGRWTSRHSMSEGGMKASIWLKDQLTSFDLNCTHQYFAEGFSPNIICKRPGINSPSSAVILSAHYDGRGTFGNTSAPAANDDGSGTALILSIARQINSSSLQFYHDVYICLFAGEEQGLLGSAYFAKSLKEQEVDIKLMLQTDMVAYRKPGEGFQLALPDLIGLIEARWLVGNISSIYVPQLEVGTTPACCSDHQSFDNLGFASTWVFERNGPIADDRYHNSGDVSRREGFDFEQVSLITKVVYATLLEVAEFVYSF